jgi:hypothetical protein
MVSPAPKNGIRRANTTNGISTKDLKKMVRNGIFEIKAIVPTINTKAIKA